MPANTPFPPPLDEGILETTYREFMSLPTPSASVSSSLVTLRSLRKGNLQSQ